MKMVICPSCGHIHMGFADDECRICHVAVIDTGMPWDSDDGSEEYMTMSAVRTLEWKNEMREKYAQNCDPKMVAERAKDEYEKHQRKTAEQNAPKCPTCNSPNITKIGGLERGASVLTLGLFSKKINKSFKCKNCGYTW